MRRKILCWAMFGLLGSGVFAAEESSHGEIPAVPGIQGILAFPNADVCEAILTCPEFIEVSQRSVEVRQVKACELLIRGYRASGSVSYTHLRAHET